jgi:deoxyribodipyrimidine photolyase-related protein
MAETYHPSNSPAAILRLILGDQLNEQHSWYREIAPEVVYVMMEVRSEQSYVLQHVKKVMVFFQAMRAFAQRLQALGHRVHYISIDQPDNQQFFAGNIEALLSYYQARQLEYQEPDEYRLDQQLSQFSYRLEQTGITTAKVSSEHFLTTRHDVAAHFEGRKQWVMESFYRHIRQQYQVLMTPDNKPVGGQWNNDALNRKKPPKGATFPAPMAFHNDYSAVWQTMQRAAVPHFGRTTGIDYPVTRVQALAQLAHFVDYALPAFGTYQDAMLQREAFLNHSLLSFALNVKLLHPLEVVQQAIAAYEEALNGPAPIHIAQVEGFVRQIIGWREYVRGIYWAKMPEYAEGNYFNALRPLPQWYWTAETSMNCLKQAIDQSLEHAYAHHIQRLMVTGNFATLIGVSPQEINAWYLGIYADAIEWVQLPNTHGMSQYADGGLMATKPYISSANYMHQMSDYCANCSYDYQQRVGPKACPFNSFYWHFLDRHRPLLARNPRMGQMYAVWDKFSATDKNQINEQAEQMLANIAIL